jgi:hypothetical protein
MFLTALVLGMAVSQGAFDHQGTVSAEELAVTSARFVGDVADGPDSPPAVPAISERLRHGSGRS